MTESKNEKINDGWEDVAYDFGLPPAENAALASLLNEACHVFHQHADGTWASQDKDSYSTKLLGFIRAHSGLKTKLLATNDRVVRMITFRALEILTAK